MSAMSGDCTVVFNEMMYHPATNEAALEWVELHNQMAVDMDISGWRLGGEIAYRFGEGVVVPGGGYLVVAVSPAALTTASGVTNVAGPFAGRLGNGGGAVTLRNNNDRLMDRVVYGPNGAWPVAPDGAGPSLAKTDEDASGAEARAWRASRETGGTPGRANFPAGAVASFVAVRFDSPWRFAAADPGEGWASADHDDSTWASGAGAFAGGIAGWQPGETAPIPMLFSTGIGSQGLALATGAADLHYVLVASAYPAVPLPVAATVMAGHPAWLANDSGSMWIGPISNGAASIPQGNYRFQTRFDLTGMDPATARLSLKIAVDDAVTQVLLNGVNTGIAGSRYDAFGPAMAISNGFAAGTNTLEILAANGGTSANPGGLRVRALGTAARKVPTNTALAVGAAARYFRTPFVLTGAVAETAASLKLVADDGAVVYVNGTEVLRLNMPGGPVSNGTPALTTVGNAGVSGPLALDTAALVTGTNLLAVELHQAAGGADDVLFGAELTLAITNVPAGSAPASEFDEPPGPTNLVAGAGAIVINEIMYHPRNPQGPVTNSPEEWIELHNPGTVPVALAGWRLDVDGETAFRFPEGCTLAGGGFLVVAGNAAHLQARYPAAAIVGDFAGRLSGRGGRIELRDGAGALSGTAGNQVDAVDYRDGPPWPKEADGLGGSLELRDPRSDNSRPEAWAASDDSAKASWQTYTYRGIATVEAASSPAIWREFVMGLLGGGVVLLDDLRVVESPSGAARPLLQNGTFEMGAAAWRFLGNHSRCTVVADPDNGANRVLRLESDGDTEHMHNHAETTLAGGAAVINGLEYEVSFRAKWIAGCNRLNTRLYFNRLARVTEIAAPSQCGTPGARNSQYAANVGPTFARLRHDPVEPAHGQPVAVVVDASDPDGIASATLWYAVNEGAWRSTPMAVASSAGGATLSAGIPGQSDDGVIRFYVEAVDGAGAVSACPAGGAASRALVEVSDRGRALPGLHTVRVILTPADAVLLHAPTNAMSNGRMACTVVCDGRAVAYDAGVHLQGSARGRDDTQRVGFTVRLPSDRPYRGVHAGFTVDRSGGYSGRGGDQDEILLKHAIQKAGGLPGMYDDLCWLYAPRSQEDGPGLLLLAKYGDEYLDSQYENGADGELFKLEMIYYPTTTVVAGNPQSPKLPQPDQVLGTDLQSLGDDPESYRWTFLKENHAAHNNYAPIMALAKAFSETGTVLDARMGALMDVDQWMRTVAFISLIGSSDMYTDWNPHNLIVYMRPADGKAMAFPWDLDYAFSQSTNQVFPGAGSANTTKLIQRPANLHAFYGHLYDLSRVTGDSAYMTRWAHHYASLVGQNWTNAVNWLADRAAYVRSQLPLTTPFAITNNAGADFAVIDGRVRLSGTAPITVKEVLVNGVSHPVTWLTATNWSVSVALTAFANPLSLRALDLHGAVVSNASDSITVTNFGQPAPLPVVINEWTADNAGPGGYPDSVDGRFQDWFELYNPNSNSVDLAGSYLTDDLLQPAQWAIPSNTVIAALGFLLVWADGEPGQNGLGDGDLHAPFKLGAGGEALGLFDADGVRQHAVQFGLQVQNVSQGLFPDGNTNGFHAMTNWTPRAANRLGPVPPPDILNVGTFPDKGIRLDVAAAPAHLYRIEFRDSLLDMTWAAHSTNRAAAPAVSFADFSPSATSRIYRAVLVP